MTHHCISLLILALMIVTNSSYAAAQDNDQPTCLATPSSAQYAYHEQERIMFVHWSPATWQGREYDNRSTPLSEINPSRLDTDQWCRIAKSWGAKQIIFVAKHAGGFCWWQTETTDYSIKSTPWRNGKGDVLAEVAASCRKHNLNLGIYVYPGDENWGAPIGSGGKTKDPNKQKAYNKIFRQQLTEVLSKYGPITEVWFDGSCMIEVGDILKKYTPNAAIFQGPYASIRWVGNEKGYLPYPSWSTLKNKELKTGVATARHNDPDGDAWAPLEADTTLYDHFWFWSPEKTKKRKSIEHLMDIYYKSVGRGGVMLLNSTPDTTGRIPTDDEKHYKKLGDEIQRRFDKPIAETAGKGDTIELDLGTPTTINHAVIMEDYRHGERIRAYLMQGWSENQWQELTHGISVGRKRIDVFEPATVSKVRLRITKAAAKPLIRKLAVFNVTNVDITSLVASVGNPRHNWKQCETWNTDILKNIPGAWEIDLTSYIPQAGQYEVAFVKTGGKNDLEIVSATLIEDGRKALPEMVTRLDQPNTFNVNRTGQITPETRIALRVIVSTKNGADSKGIVRIRMR